MHIFSFTGPRLRLGFVLSALCLGAAWLPGHAGAAEVNRTGSREFKDRAAGLLTPREEAIRSGDLSKVEADAPGVTLLDETIHHVDGGGRTIVANQFVYKALTEAGARSIAEYVHGYRKKMQKVTVIAAETIQPDGAVQAVQANAMLIQSPQRQADYALYDDQEELKLIFPNVKPGTVVRTVLVTEDVEVRMPGQYTYKMTWTRGWPVQRLRQVVDLPAELARRLRIFTLGDTPEPKKEVLPKGRVRWRWQRDSLPMGPRDWKAAPAGQIGPYVQLTTLREWAEIGSWFNDMLKGRDRLSNELAQKVDEWTKGKAGANESLAVLYDKATNDVRYTGLELGAADYQPHDCNEVWKNQYGDCKDKANLLAAMLRRKGLTAWVALLNTNHAGVIDRRAPDFKAFNHAIVALPNGDGRYTFYDPTIAESAPGTLGGSDLDRDALVIKADGVEWARTPAAPAGSADYQFDLTLKATGELSGWLNFSTTDAYGAYYAERFQKLDALDGRRSMQGLLQDVLPGAEIMDWIKPKRGAATEPYMLRAFFTARNAAEAGTGRHVLTFPDISDWLSDPGQSDSRQTTFFVYRESVRLAFEVKLPPGHDAVTVPAPYSADAAGVRVTARWHTTAGSCRGEFLAEVSKNLVSPDEFKAYFQMIQSLRSWLKKPLVVGVSGGGVVTAPSVDLTRDFPLMPSSDGQFNLLEKLFPAGGNATLRRAALGQLRAYFPEDKTAAYRAGLALALMDVEEGKAVAAVAEIRGALGLYQHEIRADYLGWGKSVLAYALSRAGQREEAIATLLEMVDDESLAADFRARQLVACGDVIKQTPSPALEARLRKAATWPSQVRPLVYVLWAHVAMQLGSLDQLRADLAEMVKTTPAVAGDLLLQVARQSQWQTLPGDSDRRESLLSLLAEFAPMLGEAYRSGVAEVREQAGRPRRLAAIQSRLRAEPFTQWYSSTATGANLSTMDFENRIAAANAQRDFNQCIQLGFQQLARQELDEYFAPRLWRLVAYAELNERQSGRALDEPAFIALLDLARELPQDLPAYYEIQLIHAAHLQRKGTYGEAATLLKSLLGKSELSAALRPKVLLALGQVHEATADFTEALRTYGELETVISLAPEAVSGVIRAVFLQLRLFNFGEAIRLIRVAQAGPSAVREKAEGAAWLTELAALVDSGGAESFWRQEGRWWSQWERMANAVGAPAAEAAVPVIPNLHDWSLSLGDDFRRRDLPAVYAKVAILASAARWLPSMTVELGDLLPLVAQVDSRWQRAMLDFGIAVLGTQGSFSDEITFRRQIVLANLLIQSGQPAKAGKALQEVQSLLAARDRFQVQVFHRLKGQAAYGSGLERKAAIKVLAAELEDGMAYPQRAAGVGILVDLLHAESRFRDEIALIERELPHPEIVANAGLQKFLLERLASLKALPAPSSPSVTVDVTALRSVLPPWFEFATPLDLNDPRLKRLEEIMQNPSRVLTHPEAIKLALLVALDEKQASSLRRGAAQWAVRALLRLHVPGEKRRKFAGKVLANPGFDNQTREAVLLEELGIAAHTNDRVYYRSLRANPLLASSNSEQAANLQVLDAYVELPRQEDAERVALIKKLVEPGLTPFRLSMAGNMALVLSLRGNAPALRELADALEAVAAKGTQDNSAAMLQAEFLKDAREIEVNAPVHAALLKVVDKHRPLLPAIEASLPDAEPVMPGVVVGMDHPSTLKNCLRAIDRREFSRTEFGFWQEFVSALPRTAAMREFTLELLSAALDAALNDEVRGQVIGGIVSPAPDWDDPAIREPLLRCLESIRQVDEPVSYAQIAFLEARVTVRTGRSLDFDTVFAGVDDPALPFAQARLGLDHYRRGKNVARLKRVLDQTPAGVLANPRLLPELLAAQEFLGMTAEAERTRQQMQRSLRLAALSAWAMRDRASISTAVRLAAALKVPNGLPPGWINEVEELPDSAVRSRVLCTDAMLREDWPQLLKLADGYLTELPTHYRLHWFKGLALVKLRREAEAVPVLELYVAHAFDEREHAEAMGYLSAFKGRAASP